MRTFQVCHLLVQLVEDSPRHLLVSQWRKNHSTFCQHHLPDSWLDPHFFGHLGWGPRLVVLVGSSLNDWYQMDLVGSLTLFPGTEISTWSVSQQRLLGTVNLQYPSAEFPSVFCYLIWRLLAQSIQRKKCEISTFKFKWILTLGKVIFALFL